MSTRRFTDQDPGTAKVIGRYATSPIGFHGATPTSQRASSTLSAGVSIFAVSGASWVANTASTLSGLFGFSSGQMAEVVDLLTEIRATLAGNGLHKGGA